MREQARYTLRSDIGEILATLRRSHPSNYLPIDIARCAQRAHQTVEGIENHKRTPSATILAAYATCLDIDAEVIAKMFCDEIYLVLKEQIKIRMNHMKKPTQKKRGPKPRSLQDQ